MITLSPLSAYWLGAVLSDGWFQKVGYMRRVGLRSIDEEFVDAFNDACFEMIGRRYSVIPEKPQTARHKASWLVVATSKGLYEWGMEQTEVKSRVPTIVMDADDVLRREFLAGVMDGDGWVSILRKPRPTWSVSTYSQIGLASCDPWLSDVKRLCDSMGLPSSGPRLMKRDNPKWRPIRMLNFKVKPFLQADVPLRIARKRNKLTGLASLL